MPQQNQNLPSFDELMSKYPEEVPPPAPVQAPTPPPQWQQTFEKVFPAASQAAHQMAQVPQGIAGMAEGMADIPGTLKALAHPLDTLGSMFHSMVLQPASTVAQGAGALVAPNSVQAPSQEEWDKAGQGATQLGASLMAGPAMKEGAAGVQRMATRAGVPQAIAGAAPKINSFTDLVNHPLAPVIGPLLRGVARMLYDPPEPPPRPVINAQFAEPPVEPYQDVASRPVVPQKQIAAPTAPKQLAEVKPGTQLFKGEEGSIPKKEQTVTAIDKPPTPRVKGKFGKPEDMSAKKGNVGKTVTKSQ